MHIRRGEDFEKDTEQMIDYCLTQLQDGGFTNEVDWDTEVAPACTLEELVGALVAAENELSEEQFAEL